MPYNGKRYGRERHEGQKKVNNKKGYNKDGRSSSMPYDGFAQLALGVFHKAFSRPEKNKVDYNPQGG